MTNKNNLILKIFVPEKNTSDVAWWLGARTKEKKVKNNYFKEDDNPVRKMVPIRSPNNGIEILF